jgi:hypothetical protein
MKKADNFDASKWLVENKITTQSKLNEGIVTAPLSNFLWKLNPKVKEWENISSTKEALSFIKSLTNEELNNLYVWRLGFDIPQSEDEKIKNLLDLIDNKIGESNLKEAEEILIEDHKDEALEAVNKFIDEFESQGLFEFIPDLNNYEIDSSTNSLNIDELGSVYLISNEGPVPNEVKELMMDSNNGEINKNGATWKKYPKNGYYYIVVS